MNEALKTTWGYISDQDGNRLTKEHCTVILDGVVSTVCKDGFIPDKSGGQCVKCRMIMVVGLPLEKK